MEVEIALPPPSPGKILPSLTKNRAPRPAQRRPTLKIKSTPIFPSDNEPETVQLESPKAAKAALPYSPKTAIQSPLQPAIKKGTNPPMPFVLPPITGKVELRPVNKSAPRPSVAPRPSITPKPTGLKRVEREEEEQQNLLEKKKEQEQEEHVVEEERGDAAGGRQSEEERMVAEEAQEAAPLPEQVEEEPLLPKKVADSPKRVLPAPISTARQQIPQERSLPSPVPSPAPAPSSWFGNIFSWVWELLSSLFK